MSYRRVLPRDLFNEAKLLKCLGRLTLLINDDLAGPLRVRYRSPYRPFLVRQYAGDGGLYVANLKFFVERPRGFRPSVYVKTRLNSRDAYPLMFSDRSTRKGDPWDGADEGEVFTNEGDLTDEFTTFLTKLAEGS